MSAGRESLIARGTRGTSGRIGREAAITLGLVVAVLVAGVLFPWFPGTASLEEGARAPWTLTAPRAISYDSMARTNEVRNEAANAVPDVLVLDPSVRDREIAELDREMAALQQVRSDSSLSPSGRETSVRALPMKLTAPAASAIVNASDERWSLIASDARAALGRVMSGTLRDTDLAAARQRATGFLSPTLAVTEVGAINELLAPLVVPTLVVDAQRTSALRSEARKGQPPVHVSHARGEVLVTEGQQLSAADLELLEHSGLLAVGIRTTDVIAAGVLALLVAAAVGGYVFVAQPTSLQSGSRQLLFVALIVVPALVTKVAFAYALPDLDRRFLVYALPLAAAPMLAAILLDTGLALLIAVLLPVIAAFIAAYLPLTQGDTAGGLEIARVLLGFGAASYAGVLTSARASRLHHYVLASAVAAVVELVALGVVWLIDANRSNWDPAWMAGAGLVSGVLTTAIVLVLFMVLRRRFGVVTRVELMELTQLSQPLLRRLQDEAPGTFQHSIVVGNLAERAAERIGADPLLVRIGAYYHDAGKLVAPPFFVENSGESNPHDTLDPLQSTRVILRHVTAGVEIAREAGLPEAVVDFIPQHHGTRLAVFFYRRAAADDAAVDPELFRYPGPRPQSREAALVMLADATEAAARASLDHSPERVREIVEAVIRERVEEGQFDQCSISLRDLRVVADSFAGMLNAIYRPRIEYPEPTARELATRRTARLDEPRVVGALAGGPATRPALPSPTAEMNEDTPNPPSDEE